MSLSQSSLISFLTTITSAVTYYYLIWLASLIPSSPLTLNRKTSIAHNNQSKRWRKSIELIIQTAFTNMNNFLYNPCVYDRLLSIIFLWTWMLFQELIGKTLQLRQHFHIVDNFLSFQVFLKCSKIAKRIFLKF